MSLFPLRAPLQFEGRDYTELSLDFESLTGNDLLDCERAFLLAAGTAGTGVLEFQKGYLIQVIARAAKVPVELIRLLSASDVTKLTIEAQGFLLG